MTSIPEMIASGRMLMSTLPLMSETGRRRPSSRTRLRLVPRPWRLIEARPPVPDHEHIRHGERSLGLVLDQDSVNLPHIQKGMHSSAYKGLWISHIERRIRQMHKTLMNYIAI